MGWHGVANATPGQQVTSLLSPFIFVDKKRSPEILVEFNLDLCNIPESSLFSCTHIVHLIVIT